jgi:ATP-dependent helicase/nuclease subunit B
MPLSLHCGPFAFLEESFVAHLTANPPGPGRRVAVVTTSQRMAERLQRLLSLERGRAFFNLRFHTLHSLSLDVLRAAGAPVPAIINDDLFHERLVERLLIDGGDLPSDRARALAGAHRATVRDLVEAGVDSASFRDHFADMEIPGEQKLHRLLSLTDRYRDRVEKLAVVTSADLARLASDAVENNPQALAGYDEFIYYGFYDLNGAQSDFFSAVASIAPVTLFFPCVKGHPGWAFAERFLELKIRVGGAVAQRGDVTEDGPLGGALAALFNPGRAPTEVAENVQILSVSGERDELWRVAKEILALREGPEPPAWDDIGVVARSLDSYAGLIPDIFGAHGIPYSVSDGGPLLSHPVAQLVVNLMELSERTHDRDAILEIVSSPCLHADVFPHSALEEAVDYLVHAGPRGGLAHLIDSPSAPSPALPEGLEPPVPPKTLRDLAARLKFNNATVPCSWAQHVAWARDRISSLVAHTEGTGPVLDQVVDVLAPLADMDRFSPPVHSAEFCSTFVDVLRKAHRLGTGPVHGVRVLGAMDARGERFDVLFMVGLKEGVFPRIVREDPLLNDDLRRVLRDPGGYWILPKREGYDEEKLLFTLLVSAVKKKLFLLFSRSGADGRAEVPSLYLRDLARVTGLSLEGAERLPRSPLEKWTAVSPFLLTLQEAGLADLLENRPVTGEDGAIAQRAARIGAWTTPTAVDGIVGRPESFLARCVSRGISPSAVETLASCPFQFFLSRLVGLREPHALYDENGVIPLVLGKIQHVLLQSVYRGFLSKTLPSPEEAVACARAETRRLFSTLEATPAGPYPLLWRILMDRVERQIADFVRRDVARLHSEGYLPEKLEWSLSAPIPGTEFLWTGRLDRMDWNPVTRRFSIVDYKNKIRKESLSKRVLAGQVYQVPAYMELVEAQKMGGHGTVRYEYLATNETEEFTEDLWRAQRETMAAQLKDLLSLIPLGRFLIHPADGPNGHCRLCSFARACRKAHGPTLKRSGGAFAPFLSKTLSDGSGGKAL